MRLPRRLEEARDFLGPAAAGAVLAFVAYLTGSITADLTTSLLRSPKRPWDRLSFFRRRIAGRSELRVGDRAVRSAEELVERTLGDAESKRLLPEVEKATIEAVSPAKRGGVESLVSRDHDLVEKAKATPEFQEAMELREAAKRSNYTAAGLSELELFAAWERIRRGETGIDIAPNVRSRGEKLDDLLEKIAGRIPYSKEEVHYVFVTDRAETRGEYIAPRLVEAVLDERDLGEKRSRVGACTRSSTSASRIAALARAFRVDACQYKIGVTTNSRALS